MNWLVFHVASGESFFTGVALVCFAAFASTQKHPVLKRTTFVAFLVGVIAIVISSTPLSYWFYAVALLATLAWIASAYRESWRRPTAGAMATALLVMALFELPYHFSPALSPAADRSLTVIGDSITAGVGGSEKSETWPNILAREHRIDVHGISHVGETAASALKRAQGNQIESVVLVEIGGNDVLGTTSATQFAKDLDALLAHVATPGRQVAMLELPLPPFYIEYGRAQRIAAARHNVLLVPKRRLLSILAGNSSTLDTIHLTQSGHQLMANEMWNVVQSAFASQ